MLLLTASAVVAADFGTDIRSLVERHCLICHGGDEVEAGVDFSRHRQMTDVLRDHTMVFYGSDLGNASSHDNRNLPALLAGGGFRHGQHLAFDAGNNHPLATLYVSMLQRLGIETNRFGSGTTTMRGLEMS